jgi:hypothetical protein
MIYILNASLNNSARRLYLVPFGRYMPVEHRWIWGYIYVCFSFIINLILLELWFSLSDIMCTYTVYMGHAVQ